MDEFEIFFQPDGRRVKVKQGTSILEAANASGLDIHSVCASNGTCGKCKVIINDQVSVQEPTSQERKKLSEEELDKDNFRLGCQVKVNSDIVVLIPESSRTKSQKLQTEGISIDIPVDPIVRKYLVKFSDNEIDNDVSLIDKLNTYLLENYNLSDLSCNPSILGSLKSKTLDISEQITITIYGNSEIIELEQGDTTNRLYGYAVDIGTTKLAGYLVDLTSGEVIVADGLINPQVSFGGDVISRISYNDPHKLHETIKKGLNKLLTNLIQKSKIKRKDIYELVAVGNTCMHHLFLDLEVKQLGSAPFTPVIRKQLITDNNNFGIGINENGKIYTMPVISGFIGSDTLAVILASEIYKGDELCMIVDVGTNTEIVLGNKNRLLTCSCASGPALEGAHIKFGMRATTGAISSIKIDPKTFEPIIETIDNAKPRGICGSAILDIPAQLLLAKILTPESRYREDFYTERVREVENWYEYVLVWGKDSYTGDDITISQKDVQEIILAKAAIHTGTEILIQEFGVNEKDIDKFLIAGAFGSHIDIDNARVAGVFPEIELDKIQTIGNAAGTGSRMCLLSKPMREIAELFEYVEYIDLAAQTNFHDVFVKSLYLPYEDLSRYPQTSELLKEVGNYPE